MEQRAGRRCPPAPRPAHTRLSSCATATSPRFGGKGVHKAVQAVRTEIADALRGMVATDQVAIDKALIELDGTPNKARLGANAILGVSLAVAKAAAQSTGLPLYRYVGGTQARRLPVPMMNIINGGAHADNPIDFQEFMIVPVGAATLADAVRMGSEVFHTLRKALSDAGTTPTLATRVASPRTCPPPRTALGFMSARSRRPDTSLARTWCWRSTAPPRSSSRMASTTTRARGRCARRRRRRNTLPAWSDSYPIVSIEDGMSEDDWEGWKLLTDSWASAASSSATTSSSQTLTGSLQGSPRGSPIPFWSRLTRLAR